MKVKIDSDRCDAMGECVNTCPEVFGQDIDGYVVLLEDPVPPELEERARLAVSRCPSAALAVDEAA
jgi:ferredoxin